MAGVKSEIGETLNVFHDAANVLRAGDCVISAHGVRAIHPRDFIVPQGVTIHFYVPKGYTGVALKSYTIDDDVSRDGPSMSVALGDSYPTPVQPAQSVTAGNSCPNYNLGKIQEKGNIDKYLNDRTIGLKIRLMDADFMKFFTDYPHARDIITVRHRRSYGEPDLESVVRLTRARGIAYTAFHCVFCRGPALVPSKGEFQVGQKFVQH